MKVIISGASGLVGTALRSSLLADGHEIAVLSRRKSLPPFQTITWDIQNSRFDASGLERAGAIVHLAGEPIAQRWTEAAKREIRASRVESTRLLVEGIKSLKEKPKLLVSASAVGFYGDGGDAELDESSPPGKGFLSELCQEWEHAAMEATGLGIRTVCVRTGIVLSTRGGALAKMLLPFKLGLGGPVGDGKQWMPWIHIEDVVGAIRRIVTNEDLMGVVNAVSPTPVRNAEFTKALGRAVHRPTILPVPAFGLELIFGEMAEILLEGQRVLPKKLLAAGYEFRYPEVSEALADVVLHRK